MEKLLKEQQKSIAKGYLPLGKQKSGSTEAFAFAQAQGLYFAFAKPLRNSCVSLGLRLTRCIISVLSERLTLKKGKLFTILAFAARSKAEGGIQFFESGARSQFKEVKGRKNVLVRQRKGDSANNQGSARYFGNCRKTRNLLPHHSMAPWTALREISRKKPAGANHQADKH